MKKKLNRIVINAAENGWVLEVSYLENGEFTGEKTWVETTANAAADRALALMTEPAQATEPA